MFLRTVSATIIPALAVPVSLVATCGVIYFLGFSINNMTLLALTLSVGFVVDDAIVMLENIVRHIEGGMRPYEAALKANGKKYQLFVYDGANHGFHNDTTPRYDEAAATLAWQRTLEFFNQNLRG